MPVEEDEITRPSQKFTFVKPDGEGMERMDLHLPGTKWKECEHLKMLAEDFTQDEPTYLSAEESSLLQRLADNVTDEGHLEVRPEEKSLLRSISKKVAQKEPAEVTLGQNISFSGVQDGILFAINRTTNVQPDHGQRHLDFVRALDFLKFDTTKLPKSHTVPWCVNEALDVSLEGLTFAYEKGQHDEYPLTRALPHLIGLMDGPTPLVTDEDGHALSDFLDLPEGRFPLKVELTRTGENETPQLEASLLGADLAIISSRQEEALRWGWSERRVFAGVRLLPHPARNFYVEVLLVGDWSKGAQMAIGGFPKRASMAVPWRMSMEGEEGRPLEGIFVSLRSKRLHIGVGKVDRVSRMDLEELPDKNAFPRAGSHWAVEFRGGMIRVGANTEPGGMLVWQDVRTGDTPVPQEELCPGLLLQPRFLEYEGSAQVQILRVEALP